jgi:hypothetical protein
MNRLPRDAKRRGEQAELAFMLKASRLGFTVSKPYGDSASYDFVVDRSGTLWRVQVKSSSRICKRAFHISASSHSSGVTRSYDASEIDFLVAYVVPRDTWYVIPVAAFAPRKSIRLYPHAPAKDKLYGRFREAWHLLKLADRGSRGWAYCPFRAPVAANGTGE